MSVFNCLRPPAALKSFRRDESGVAAVEFAIIAPLLIMTYLGVLELSQGFQASRKVSLYARAAADLTSQGPKDPAPATDPIPAAEIDDIYQASKWIMHPFPMASGQIRLTISSVVFKTVSSTTKAYTDWSITFGGTRRSCGELTLVANSNAASLTSIPTGIADAGKTVIVADAAYDYMPLLGGSFRSFGSNLTSVTVKQTAYMRPRNTVKLDIATGVPNSVRCNVAFP